jgi:hypothetical protein
MSNSLSPTFVLGVGAQKAGTSWLHRQLTKSPFVNMGFTKEYHVWDAIFCELAAEFRATLKVGEGADHALRRMMQSVEGAYENYFSQLDASREGFQRDKGATRSGGLLRQGRVFDAGSS